MQLRMEAAFLQLLRLEQTLFYMDAKQTFQMAINNKFYLRTRPTAGKRNKTIHSCFMPTTVITLDTDLSLLSSKDFSDLAWLYLHFKCLNKPTVHHTAFVKMSPLQFSNIMPKYRLWFG